VVGSYIPFGFSYCFQVQVARYKNHTVNVNLLLLQIIAT
jgi:hypothetical protein